MSNLIEHYNFLQNVFGIFGDCYICGGSVRDTLMGNKPKDYDLFILTDNLYKTVHPNVVNKIVEHGLKEVKSDLEFHKSEPFMLSQIDIDGDRIQIMWSDKPNIDALLDSFDWNVSLFAYGKNGFTQWEKIENIGMGKELWLWNTTFPSSTLRRGYRFSERFGMYINQDDFASLISKVYLKHQNQCIKGYSI